MKLILKEETVAYVELDGYAVRILDLLNLLEQLAITDGYRITMQIEDSKLEQYLKDKKVIISDKFYGSTRWTQFESFLDEIERLLDEVKKIS